MYKKSVFKFSYIYFFVISAILLLLLSLQYIKVNLLLHIVCLILLTVIYDYKPISTIRSGEITEITMTFTAHFMAMVIFGTEIAVFIATVSAIIVEIVLLRKPFYKGLFNAGQYGVSILISGALFHLLKLSSYDVVFDIIKDMPALLVAILLYYSLNIVFVCGIVSLNTGENFIRLVANNLEADGVYYYTLTPITIAMILLYNPKIPIMPFLMLPPMFIADRSLNRYYRLKVETHETFKALADIIDKRDEYTFLHSTRVAEYAGKIAQTLGKKPSFINGIETAGRVHDLGKIAIEDKVLKKYGGLTDEEYNAIKQHPEIGYLLIKNLKPYEEIAEFVLYHHERIDGKGYPKGITAEKIPLGARILAVADSYDAMTSDRPYRKALLQNVAVKELIKCSGTQFDAEIVNVFIKILKKEYGYLEE